ncbi:MAG: hypothetical protein QOI80_568, partial [Solirubrobacteraceae bacterium]|nr:hypothetical protein [Solirubrobacteraceae bacterium]
PRWPATLLALLSVVLAAAGVVIAVRRRAWLLPALVGAVVVAAIPVLKVGAPWIDAKVLSLTAPVVLAAAAAAVVSAGGPGWWRAAATVTGLVLAAGCLASSWLVARDVYIAPRSELVELRALGDQLDGKGPTLVLNYEGYGTRYYLGPADDEGVSELRYNQIPSRDGNTFPNFATAEVDDIDQQALFSYPVIVRRRTPVGSRPPSGYRTVHAGRFFEAWQRDRSPLPADHISLGDALAPAAKLTCTQARVAAAKASTLTAAPSVNPVLVALTAGRMPVGWFDGTNVRPRSDGDATVPVTLPQAGDWRVWVGGGVLGKLTVRVDGKAVGSYRHQLDASVGWLRFGAKRLGAGRHTVTLAYSRGWGAGRGSDDGQLPLGPVALSLEDQPALVRVPASGVRRLCDGRTYDWLETFK